MMLTLAITNSFAEDMLVGTSVAAEEVVPAGRSIEYTLDYTEDMGPLRVVLEPLTPGQVERKRPAVEVKGG